MIKTISNVPLYYWYQLNLKPKMKKDRLKKPETPKVKINLVSGGVTFTRRQAQCAYYACMKITNSEIAEKMQLSKRTVEDHLQVAKVKLNCKTKSELRNFILSNHLLPHLSQFPEEERPFAA